MAVEYTEKDRRMVRSYIERKQRADEQALAARLERARKDFSKIVAYIIANHDPVKILQWGSLIDGEHFSEISDIDIALEGVTDPAEFFKLLGSAEKMTDLPLDIVQLECIHPAYAEGIRRQGRLVYERKG
jgi:hypothetical protein